MNVSENPHVRSGLSWENIKWAFQFTQEGDKHYWHPLTSISHMTDCHFFRLDPRWHHLSNLIWHIANTILLYLLLLKLTSARWKSFLVAALFAFHPINVESVAWIAERKNVLSTFFWFLSMHAYIFYLKKPQLLRYIVILIAMLLGLLSKPILAVLPCAMLLIDIWPLKRIELSNTAHLFRRSWFLFVEKIPFFILSSLWIYLSSLSMDRLGVVISYESVPLDIRIANAIVSYPLYLFKIIWPFNLAIYYPYPAQPLPFRQIVASAICLACISALALMIIKKKPWFASGWFWFIGILFPVIGLMQNGLWPAMADRWAYLPNIGIFIIIIWGISNLLSLWKLQKKATTIMSVVFFPIFFLTLSNQITYWTDNITLFQHAAKVTENNAVVYNNLAGAFIQNRNFEKGIQNYRMALKIDPNFQQANFNLGRILATLKKTDEAKFYLEKAITIDPSFSEAYHNLGSIFMMEGDYKRASRLFYQAIQLNPTLEIAYYNLGIILANQGKLYESMTMFAKAIQLKPDFLEAQSKLKVVKKTQSKLTADKKNGKMQLESKK